MTPRFGQDPEESRRFAEDCTYIAARLGCPHGYNPQDLVRHRFVYFGRVLPKDAEEKVKEHYHGSILYIVMREDLNVFQAAHEYANQLRKKETKK